MGNNYLHRKWVIRIILFILLLGAVGMTKAMAQTNTYTPASAPIRDTIKAKTVGIIPYSDDFITQEEVMERNYAITSFRMIDTTTVAVLTGASDMIMVYSLDQNQILRKIQLPIFARAFEYDNGLFHVIGDRTYLSIDADGRICERKDFQQPQLPNEEIFVVSDLKIVDGQPIIHECNANTYSITSDGLQKIDTCYFDHARSCKIHPQYIDENSFTLFSETPSRSGRHIVSMESLGLEGKLACLNSISVDDDFIAINLETSHNRTGRFVKSYLLVINSNGELINLVEVPINFLSYIHKPFLYYGNAWYYAFSGQEGISIFKIDTNTNRIDSPDSFILSDDGFDYSYLETNNGISYEDTDGNGPTRDNWRTITQAWENAERYCDMEWTPVSGNVSPYCTPIINNRYIITPVSNCNEQTGVPYKYGGFTNWDIFKSLAADGTRYTGNKHCYKTTDCYHDPYQDGVNTYVLGVDCSGFVSRCWELSSHIWTGDIPNHTQYLGDLTSHFNDGTLRTCDALNFIGRSECINVQRHVMMYAYHTSDQDEIMVFESSATGWKTAQNSRRLSYFQGNYTCQKNINGTIYTYSYPLTYTIQRYPDMRDIRLRLGNPITMYQNDPNTPVTTVTKGQPLTVEYSVTNAGSVPWTGYVYLYIEQSNPNGEPNGNPFCINNCGEGKVLTTIYPGETEYFTFSNNEVISPPGTTKLYVKVENYNAGDYGSYQPYDVGDGGYSNPLVFQIVEGSPTTSYVINASASPSAGGTVSGAGTYIEGSICTLNATPSSDYNFVKWSKNGTQVSTNPVYSFQVTESASYVASFVEKPIYYNISVSASPSNGGTVTGSGNYVFYAHVTLTATPNPGYVFERWTKNGTQVSTNPNYMIVVTGDANYEAVFSANSTGSGILSGIFSVGANTRVNFSQGNLQYQASSNTWRFATNQYDYLGSGNANISSSYSGWIDLFCWGTSGYNHGAVCYQPWSTSTTNSDYYAYGSYTYNLYDQTGKADWGYNRISNGGNTLDSWRTPTRAEWAYMLNTRNTASGIRYAKAQVNGVKGLILLPDDWSASYYSLNSTNTSGADFSTNVISSSVWANNLESHGAVFLPTAGMRFGTQLGSIGVYGLYWSSSYYDSDNAGYLVLGSDRVEANDVDRRGGVSVRLVTPVQNTAYTISVSANPSYGGSVSGGGTYIEGSTCVLTATPATGYSFVRWTKNGSQVSTNPSYSFTVTGNASYVAVFSLNSYTISASASPSSGGSVSGAGSYNYGSTCTLNASANTGYSFVCWMKNGSQVSTNASFSFTVAENASYVAVFNLDSYTISVSASPSAGGSVSGAGSYNYGNSCTLTATPATGYSFVCWTKNGSQVSTNPNYSFTVTGNASCVAVFSLNTYTISASANSTLWGTVSGAGTYSFGSICTLTATPNTGCDFVRWTENGSQVSTYESYSFMVTGNASYVAVFEESTITQSQPLSTGWNWWSSYVELNGAEGLSMLENGLGSAGQMIKSRSDGYVESYTYNGTTGWFGSLTSISNEQMYKINMNSSSSAAVTGYLVSTSNHPITIGNGWNWIGFPLNQSVGVAEALSGFSPAVDDVLKGRNSYTTYFSNNGTTGWFGSLNTLEPGYGYMYQSQSSGTKTLVFQPGRGEVMLANITPENNIYQPSDQRFADNMTVTAVIEVEDEELRSDSHELAAFVDDECRGSVRLLYVEPIDRYVAFLTVFGETGDALEFRLTDGTDSQFSTDMLSFASDGGVGTLALPKVLHFGTLGLGETSAMVRIYPNPVRRKGTLNVSLPEASGTMTVEIGNMLGVTVLREEVVMDPTSVVRISLPDAVLSGTYILKAIRADGNVYYGKLVVE